jgi:hypothetical protein
VTVSPDEGMQLLTQRMTADRIVAGADGAGPDDPGGEQFGGEQLGGAAGLGIMVRLAAAMEASNAIARTRLAIDRLTWERGHPIEIPPGQLAAAGTLADPDRYGPSAGFAWRVLGIAFVLGAGATQFSVWLDSPNDPTNLVFQSAVSGRWEPAHFFLLPNRQLVYTCVGGGLTVCKGNAFEFAVSELPRVIS